MENDSLIRLNNLRHVLLEIAKDAQETYRYQLAVGGKNASHKLADSAKCYVEHTGTLYEVKIDLLEYWKYVEGGAQGTESSPAGAVFPSHFPPPWAIEKWVNVKPVIPRPMDNGNLPSPKQLSYMIAHSIEKRGIPPHPALQATIDEIAAKWNAQIEEAFAKDVQGWLSDTITILAGSAEVTAFVG